MALAAAVQLACSTISTGGGDGLRVTLGQLDVLAQAQQKHRTAFVVA